MDVRIERIRMAMEDYFGADAKRIGHALRVTGYAGEILLHEPGDSELVLATALLHDIGIREAERKYGSSAGDLQEREGPPVARKILEELGYGEDFVQEVCAIIASHHSRGEVDSDNFRVIWDADWLVNLVDEVDCSDRERLPAMIGKIFMTATGRALARKIYLVQ
ncbi:MAG: HD domain-containing protein [Geobacteraceae bacterium]|nr:HD domain-containing protein [Geobacteraceae bacterium]